MICNHKYLYKIHLETGSDVARFNRICARMEGRVLLVSHDRRLNAKSFLGVHLARMTWDEIFVESDYDCYFELREFMAD